MSNSKSSRTRDESLAFFGAMIAGQSHELTNVLNIISELAGLQLDLSGVEETGSPVDLARLHDVAARIQNQVHRGEKIIRNINRFAHSVDLPVAVFDLEEAIERVLFLAERSARLARVELVSDLPSESIVVESNPFCVQQAVFTCIDLALRSATDKRRVTVGYTVREDDAEIRIASADQLVDDEIVNDKVELLQLLLEGLGGALLEGPGDGANDLFVLSIPQHHGAGSGEE